MDHLRTAEKYICEVPAVERVALMLNVRPIVVVFMAAAVALLVFGQCEESILSFAGFFYPAWQSFRAMESGDSGAWRQWLAYWVVYASFSVVELFSDVLLFWVPFYYVLKLGFVVWLALPQWQGATVIYERFLRPAVTAQEARIEAALDALRHASGRNALRRAI